MVAVNDGILLDACIYRILKKHFRQGWRPANWDPPLQNVCPCLSPSLHTPPPLPRPLHSSLPCYATLLDLFHEVTFQTAHGQLLDTTTAPIGTVRAQAARCPGVRIWER